MSWEEILTINARNWIYLRFNTRRGRKIADSKLLTKKILNQEGIPVPRLITVFSQPQEVIDFAWEKLSGDFVVKPAGGYGGEGILVIKSRAKWAGEWFLMDGRKIDIPALRLHCLDILQGRFNPHGDSDKVLVEERVKIHPVFLRFTKSGTPDIRVIVFNRVPVMAMLRIPTEESAGKANLHQGAIGLGVDLATGITTFGVRRNQLITKIYDRRRKRMVKVNGFKIPHWHQILKTAVECQFKIPALGFVGVDIVLDKEAGPLVLELNARPGLSIQICNRAGLRGRLRRVKGLVVRSPEHGIKIAQALFGESFVDRVIAQEGVKVVEVIEPVKIKPARGRAVEVLAKIDTGAYRSSIDEGLAQNLGLLTPENILFTRHYRGAIGRWHQRQVIGVTFYLKGRRIKTTASVTKRSHLKTPLLIGRRDLGGFLVKPQPVRLK